MRMRSITEHLAAALALAVPGTPVTVHVDRALGLVLAAPPVAQLPVPPFSNSAVDGFLVRDADLAGPGPWSLPVAGDVPAGAAAREVTPGHALRIMTGAPVGDEHAGVRVIPVEDTDIAPGPGPLPAVVTVDAVHRDRNHIRRAGENTAVGEEVMPIGTRIDAGALAALVSCGIPSVTVHPRPRVAVLSSGDELVDPGTTPGAGQLPDSNRPMITALLAELGVTATNMHAGDDTRTFRTLLDELCADHDLVITTGGVSVGAFDVVREVTGSGDMWFGPVAQRPGAPQGLGTRGGAVLMCLPGNPVAAFVSFCVYAPGVLAALAGAPTSADLWERPHVTARVADGVTLPASPERAFLAPVRLTYGRDGVTAAPFNRRSTGSHLVGSLAATDGLAVIDAGADRPEPGSTVRVLLRRL